MEIDFTTQLAAARELQEILAESPQVLDYLHTVERLDGQPVLPVQTDCYISARQAGAQLAVSKQIIYRYVRSGRLTPYYLPDVAAMRFKLSDVLGLASKGVKDEQSAF